MTAVAPPPAAAPGTTPAAAGTPPAATPPASPPAAPPVTPVAAAPVLPEKYSLKIPDKSFLDPKVTDRVAPLLKELKVPDDSTAQKVLDAIHGEAAEVIRVHTAALAPGGTLHTAMREGFEADALADPFLGNGSKETLGALSLKAGELLAHYGPEYAARLRETGEAVHPAFLRMMKRLMADFGEKGLARGPAAASAPTSTLYPNGIPLDSGSAAAGP